MAMSEIEQAFYERRGATIDALENRIEKLLVERDIQAMAIREARNDIVSEKTRNSVLAAEVESTSKLARFYGDCLAKLMAWIAVDVCLQKTHRDRNAYFRGIIQTIKYWLDISIKDIPQDMDDVPF